MSSDILPVLQGIAEVVTAAIFLFAAFRAVTIGRALVNRVYRNRAYATGVFAILVVGDQLVPGAIYGIFLVFVFVLLDSTILVSLNTDFFHRNTLRWGQVRLVAYPLMVAFMIAVIIIGPSPISPLPSNFLSTLPGEIVGVVLAAILVFVFVYSTLTAIVSARRSSDIPLKRFMEYAGILVLLFLVNTLIFVLVTEAIAPFLFIVFGYVTYRMAMSLSPVGKLQKAVEATTPSQ